MIDKHILTEEGIEELMFANQLAEAAKQEAITKHLAVFPLDTELMN